MAPCQGRGAPGGGGSERGQGGPRPTRPLPGCRPRAPLGLALEDEAAGRVPLLEETDGPVAWFGKLHLQLAWPVSRMSSFGTRIGSFSLTRDCVWPAVCCPTLCVCVGGGCPTWARLSCGREPTGPDIQGHSGAPLPQKGPWGLPAYHGPSTHLWVRVPLFEASRQPLLGELSPSRGNRCPKRGL